MKLKHSLLSTTLLLTLVTPSPSAFSLEIPAEWGQVYEESQGANGKTLVLLQEAHVDYGAQKSIAEILKSLVEKEGLRLILVEGGWDDVSLSYLRSYGSPEGRVEVAERYLREGKISGEEYLDIISDLDLNLWGIEDPKLYEENMKAFFGINEKQSGWLADLAQVEALLNGLKEKVFPAAVVELEKKKRLLEEKKISLVDYLRFLKASHPEAAKPPKDLDPSAASATTHGGPTAPFGGFGGPQDDGAFPHLRKLLSATGLDGAVDPEKAEWEKQGLVKALSNKLTQPELERLELLKDRKSLQEELEFLRSLLEHHRKYSHKLKSVPILHLARYTASLAEASRIDSRKVFEELGLLESKIVVANLKTPEQKRLWEISRAAGLVRKLFELKLSPAEFAEMEKNPRNFKPGEWEKFIADVGADLVSARPNTGRPQGPPLQPVLKRIEESISVARKFYSAAAKREKALVENAVRKIETEGEPLAALVVGGFHADHLAEALKSRGYSLVTVAPRFTPGDAAKQSRHYFEILKYKWGSGAKKS